MDHPKVINWIQGDQLDLNPLKAPRLIAIQLVNLGCPECSDPFQIHTVVYQSTYANALICTYFLILHVASRLNINDCFMTYML